MGSRRKYTYVWLDHPLEDGRDLRDDPLARFQLFREGASYLEEIMWERDYTASVTKHNGVG